MSKIETLQKKYGLNTTSKRDEDENRIKTTGSNIERLQSKYGLETKPSIRTTVPATSTTRTQKNPADSSHRTRSGSFANTNVPTPASTAKQHYEAHRAGLIPDDPKVRQQHLQEVIDEEKSQTSIPGKLKRAIGMLSPAAAMSPVTQNSAVDTSYAQIFAPKEEPKPESPKKEAYKQRYGVSDAELNDEIIHAKYNALSDDQKRRAVNATTQTGWTAEQISGKRLLKNDGYTDEEISDFGRIAREEKYSSLRDLPDFAENSGSKIDMGNDATYQHMTDEERSTYNYLKNTGRDDEASDYYWYVKPEVDKRTSDEVKAEAKELLTGVDENGKPKIPTAGKIAIGAALTGYSAAASIPGAVESFLASAEDIASGRTPNGNDSRHQTKWRANTAHDLVSEMIGEAAPNARIGNVNIAQAGYDVLYSTLQSVLGAGAAGNAYTIIMGMGAAAEEAEKLSEQGVDRTRIVENALAKGIAEAFFEKFSIDNLVKTKSITGWKSFLKESLKQAGIEGSEEVFTEITNQITDRIIMGEDGEYAQSVGNYMSQGMSQEEAEAQAGRDIVSQVLLSGIEGFLSGGLAGAGMNAMQMNVNAKTGSQMRQNVSDADIVNAYRDTAPEGSVTAEYAQEYADRLSKNKPLTNMQVGAIANQSVAEMQEQIDSAPRFDNQKRREVLTDVYNRKSRLGTMLGNNKVEAVDGEVIDTTTPDNATSKIARISDVADGGTVVLDNGNEADLNNIEFSTRSQENLYRGTVQLASELGLSTEDANAIVQAYNTTTDVTPAQYLLAAKESIVKGMYGIDRDITVDATYTDRFTQAQKDYFTSIGEKMQTLGETRATQIDEQEYNRISQKLQDLKLIDKGHLGKVTFNGQIFDKKNYADYDAVMQRMSTRQKATVRQAQFLTKFYKGLNINFIESKQAENGRFYFVDENGVERTLDENGHYSGGKSQIFVDLNSGRAGEGMSSYTLAHELVHYVRDWSKTAFDSLGNEVVKLANGAKINDKYTVNDLVEAKMRSENLSYDRAFEEVVAQSFESMLADKDQNVIKMLAKLNNADATTFDRIHKFITDMGEKLSKAYNEIKGSSMSMEGKFIADMNDDYERLQKLFAEAVHTAGTVQNEALASASERVKENKLLADAGITINKNGDTRFSVRYILDETQLQEAAKKIAKETGDSVKRVEKWLREEQSLANIILNPMYFVSGSDRSLLDYYADSNEKAIKKNSDYKQGTVDFGNNCPKRRYFTEVMNRVFKKVPNFRYTGDDLADIRKIMIREGMTVACGICYVEDRRQRGAMIATEFQDSLENYRNGIMIRPDSAGQGNAGKQFNAGQMKAFGMAKTKYVPSVGELITEKGLADLKANHNDIYNAWWRFNNARGMAAERLILPEAEYKREIRKYSPTTVKRKNAQGGLRVFSFSDFELFHLLDMYQVIADAAEVGLYIQGYTKVPAFARMVMNTGVKLNMSLIPAGELGYHMEGDKVVLDYDTTEGIDINDEDYKAISRDNPNVGNIVIGINDVQIRAAMKDGFIDYIIPFHTGQSESVLKRKGIDKWDNYKEYQTEKKADGTSAGVINIYTDVLQAAEKEGKPIKNKVEFVNKFLDVCKERGLTPRFERFLDKVNGEYVYTEGYEKLLLDFKMFDSNGNILPQGKVKPDFDSDFLTKTLESYGKLRLEQYEDVEAKMPKVVDAVIKEVIGDRAEEVRKQTRDSSGKVLSNQQEEFFKDSVVRDDQGRLLRVYHGSEEAGFNIFNNLLSKVSRKVENGFFFTDSPTMAYSYSGSSDFYAPDRNTEDTDERNPAIYESYLNIKNPLVIDGRGSSWDEVFDFYEGVDWVGPNDLTDEQVRLAAESLYMSGLDEFEDYDTEDIETLRDMLPTGNELPNYGEIYGVSKDGNSVDAVQPSMATREWVEEALSGDYDGVIFKNIVDNGPHEWRPIEANVYVAFNSNQIKSVNNTEPTKNDDIRHQIRTTADGTQYVTLDKNIFSDANGNPLTAKQAYNALIGQKIQLPDGDTITFVKRLPGNFNVYNELFRKFPAFKNVGNIKAVNETLNKNITDIITASRKAEGNAPKKHNRIGVVSYDSRQVYVFDGKIAYNLMLTIANLTNGNKAAYAKSYIERADKKTEKKIKKAEVAWKSPPKSAFSAGISPATTNTTTPSPESQDPKQTRDTVENVTYVTETPVEGASDGMVDDVRYSKRIPIDYSDEKGNVLDRLKKAFAKGEYDEKTNPDGGYIVTYKSMSFWGYDEDGNAILRSPMAERVDGKMSEPYLMPKDKTKPIWYMATETIDEETGLPAGLKIKTKKPGNKDYSYVDAVDNRDLLDLENPENWDQLYFLLRRKNVETGKNEDVIARYNPYEHSSNSVFNDQFKGAFSRPNLVTVKMYVPIDEHTDKYRAKYSKDPTGWTEWKSGEVFTKIKAQNPEARRDLYLSRYAAPAEIMPDSEVARLYKEQLEGTTVEVPDNVVPPSLLTELEKIGVPIEHSGKIEGWVNKNPKVAENNPVYRRYLAEDRYQKRDTRTQAEKDADTIKDLRELLKAQGKVVEFSSKSLQSIAKSLIGYSGAKETTDVNKVANELGKFYRWVVNTGIDTGTTDDEKTYAKIYAKTEKIAQAFGVTQSDDLAREVIESMFAAERLKTVGTQHAEKIAELKAKHKNELFNEKLASDIYYGRKIKELREQRDRKLEEQRQHTSEQKAKERESRNMRQIKERIYKKYNDLAKRLTSPSEKRYVPADLVNTVASVLDGLNLMQNDTFMSGERAGETIKSKARANEKLALLKTKYDALQKDETYKAIYDPVVADMLQSVIDNIGDTPVEEMTLAQMQDVYTLLNTLDHTIREAVNVTLDGKKVDAFETGKAMMSETNSVRRAQEGAFAKYLNTQLRADTMFNRLSGYTPDSTWGKMARRLNEGQNAMTRIIVEGSAAFQDLVSATKELARLGDYKHELVDLGLAGPGGRDMPITRGMMLSLYMHLLNEDNAKHVLGGGLTIPNIPAYYKGDNEKAWGAEARRAITADVITLRNKIESQLTDYEWQWIKRAQWFFDEYSRDILNEATMRAYGFKKAGVNNYFPIHTDKNYRAAAFETIARNMSLENAGFMKERVHASNPILLEDLTEVIFDQLNKTAQYAGIMPAVKDFNKVYNTILPGYTSSLQKVINNKFGAAGNRYIENLLADLQGARKSEKSELMGLNLDRARGHMAQAVLSLNLRVAASQAASYPTAAAEIGWKPLAKALAHGGKGNKPISKADRELIAKYSPLLEWRLKGNSTTELGNIKETRKGSEGWILQKTKGLMGWISGVDGATVGRLWYAAQYYVDDTTDLEKGTDEYYKKVAEVFNNVVEKTQPNYTTMQRPDVLRSTNQLVKAMTMFMTQRLQNFNIVYDSAAQYAKQSKDLKAGLNGVTEEDVKNSQTQLIRAVSSQVVAGVTLVGMKAVTDAILHNMKRYKDDDDDVTWWSILKTLGSDFLEAEASAVLWGSELYDLISSMITKERYYGISVQGIDALGDVMTDVHNITTGFTRKKAVKLATDLCTFFGIPATQAKKYVDAITGWYEDITDGGGIYSNVE